MGSLAVFGITNDGANLVVSLLILFLLVFWLALVYWTNADARRRIDDPMLVGCATAAALFPFVGTIVYMIVRPPEYIDDRRERELELLAAEARLASIEQLSCPYCAFDVERSFLRCPSCLRRLKEPCGTCGKPLDPRWKLCPYCEADIGQPPSQPRRRERRRERPAAAPATDPARQGKPPRVSEGRRAAAPASGNGEPVPQVSSESGAPRKARPPRTARAAAPARDGREQPRPAADERRPQRPRERGRPQRPSAQAPEQRSNPPAPEQPASDEVTSEQPASRPRTRPPSAG